MKDQYDPLPPVLVKIEREIAGMKIDQFPTMRAARLAVELMDELRRVAANQKPPKEK